MISLEKIIILTSEIFMFISISQAFIYQLFLTCTLYNLTPRHVYTELQYMFVRNLEINDSVQGKFYLNY